MSEKPRGLEREQSTISFGVLPVPTTISGGGHQQ